MLSLQVLGALSSEKNLLMATLMWWAVCYSPADIVYTLATNKVKRGRFEFYHFAPPLRLPISLSVWLKRSTGQKRLWAGLAMPQR